MKCKKQYMFTWSTGLFYSRNCKGKVKRIDSKSLPKRKRTEVVKNAPNYT